MVQRFLTKLKDSKPRQELKGIWRPLTGQQERFLRPLTIIYILSTSQSSAYLTSQVLQAYKQLLESLMMVVMVVMAPHLTHLTHL